MIQAHISKGLHFSPRCMWQRKGFDIIFKAEIVELRDTMYTTVVDFIFYTGSNQSRPVSMTIKEFVETFEPLGTMAKPQPVMPVGISSARFYEEDEGAEGG